MARLFIFLNILFVLFANTTSLTEHNPEPKPIPKQKPRNFAIPILKDTKTGLYYTNITVGQPPLTVNLVLDVSGSALYFHCGDVGYNSTTYAPILCGSRGCPQPKASCSTITCYGPFGPACRNDTCISADVESYLADTSEFNYLLKDDVMLSYTSPSAYVAPKLPIRARIACVTLFDTWRGLPYGANGILGLANSSTSFVSDLVSSYKIPFKVALCLPSKSGKDYSGNAYIGGGPYLLPPNRKDVTGLLVSTPLKWEHERITIYTIDVTSIEVNGKRVASNGNKGPWGPTLVGKPIPYTRLYTSTYKALVKAFAGNNQKRKAVAPFTDCFSYTSFGGKSLLGKETPVISLVLGGGAKWDIYGPNSLVKVDKNIVCLAFEEAYNEVYPIEIGGYQMEDNLVEFDLEASKFSVTSSLLRHNTSCSPQ